MSVLLNKNTQFGDKLISINGNIYDNKGEPINNAKVSIKTYESNYPEFDD